MIKDFMEEQGATIQREIAELERQIAYMTEQLWMRRGAMQLIKLIQEHNHSE